jgi:hypothetical protein
LTLQVGGTVFGYANQLPALLAGVVQRIDLLAQELAEEDLAVFRLRHGTLSNRQTKE